MCKKEDAKQAMVQAAEAAKKQQAVLQQQIQALGSEKVQEIALLTEELEKQKQLAESAKQAIEQESDNDLILKQKAELAARKQAELEAKMKEIDDAKRKEVKDLKVSNLGSINRITYDVILLKNSR